MIIDSHSSIFSHAFLAFPDDASASAAIKQGATFKGTPLRVAFQTKRPEPQKRSLDTSDSSGSYSYHNEFHSFFEIEFNFPSSLVGPKAKKAKSDGFGGKTPAIGNGLQAKGKKTSDDDDDDDDDSVSYELDFLKYLMAFLRSILVEKMMRTTTTTMMMMMTTMNQTTMMMNRKRRSNKLLPK